MATVFNLYEGIESARELSDVIAERNEQSFNRLAQITNEEQRVSALSPTALHGENIKKQEEQKLEARADLEHNQKIIQTKAADEIFSRQIADQIAAKVDPSKMIQAAIPGYSQWGMDADYNFAMRLKNGDTFSGKDLVKSVYATKQVVTDMLGEGHAAIFDRAFVAPLDPNFRLQQSAKDAVAPFIGEMQKNGSFSPNYTDGTVGVVQDDINMGVVEKALRGSLKQLQDGANPSDAAIAAMTVVADSKGFEKYPDAAKHYVLKTVAEKIDLLSNNLTAKVGVDVSALFNSIDQETNTVIAGMGVDFDVQELMPVPQNERSGLVREITTTRDEIQKNQQFLIANEGILSIPWADRKVKEQYQVVSADNDKMKERLAQLYKKATRDIPQEQADPVGAALFGIGASAIDWGTDPDNVEKELGGLAQNFDQMNPSDQRKFLAERLVNNWYAANSKDPTKAPINAEIRSKMLNAIRTGQKLSPEIEDSLNTVMQNFKVTQQNQEQQLALTYSIASANTVEELQKTVDSYKVDGKLPSQIQTLVNTRAAAIGEKQRNLASGLKTLETTLDSDNPMYVAHDENGKPLGAVSLNATEDADGNPVDNYAKARLDIITHYSQFGKEVVNEMLGKLDAAKAKFDSTEAVKSKISWWGLSPIGTAIKTGANRREVDAIKGEIKTKLAEKQAAPQFPQQEIDTAKEWIKANPEDKRVLAIKAKYGI